MLVLEGINLFDKGKPIGKLELSEGQKSDRFVIVESSPGALRSVELNEVEKRRLAVLSEAQGGKGPKVLMTLEGTFQRSDTVNANNRVYPEAIWKKVFEGDSKWLKAISHGEMLGEADHPKDGETLLGRVACMVTELSRGKEDQKEIRGRLVVFDTAAGRNLKAIHEGGGRLGVSSRGQGSVVRLDGKDVVQEDYDLQTWDVVHNPSTPGAYPNEVEESLKRVTESAQNLTEVPEVTETRPATKPAVLERVSRLQVRKDVPIHEALAAARSEYRKAVGVEGPLSEDEASAITLFVQAVRDGTIRTGAGAVAAKITFRSGTLGEAVGTVELRAPTLTELRKRIDERLGAMKGTVEVEIDRSEEIYEECSKRFASLLESQLKAVDEAAASRRKAEDEATSSRASLSEVSAKLASAKALIEKFAARVKSAESERTDLVETEEAAERLIEALSDEFREEGLRSAVAAVAATNPDLATLPDELCRATSISEVVAITKSLRDRSFGIIEREPIGIRNMRISEALQRSRDAEAQLLVETRRTEKSESPELNATKTVVEVLQKRGLK